MPSLFDLIIEFRSHAIALTADIEKAFLQISIQESDRDYLRLYWFDDITSDNPTIVQYRYCRLPFELTSSPAILGATLHTHLSKYREIYTEAFNILSRFYVDDLTGGCDCIQSGMNIYKAAKEITSPAGFNLRKWASNSKQLIEQITALESDSNVAIHSISDQSNNNGDSLSGEDNQTYAKANTGTHLQDDKTKVLGVQWDTDTDRIVIDIHDIVQYAQTLPITKRSLLKFTAKIFDPLGALSPFVIKLKSVFQQMCVEGLGWDDDLQGEFRLKYFNLISELQDLQCISFPRWYFKDREIVSIQLHGFSDASENAFASAIYLRTEYEGTEVEINFVSSKARVSPLKAQSIPRLELMGALLLAKHMDSVKSALKIERPMLDP